MICATLTAPRGDELLRRHAELVAQGIELVEWRIDHLQEPFALKELLAKRPGPVIATVRLPEDGGKYVGPEGVRRSWLKAAVEAGVEYVDLERETALAIPRTGSTRRIVSLHDFDGTPEDAELARLATELKAADADIVKLATTAKSNRDSLRMLEFVRGAAFPVVGLCMGEYGLATRVLARKFGAQWTYAAPAGQAAAAPGQLTVSALRNIYRSHRIHSDTELYGVIGDPVGHSLSPQIHNAAFGERAMNRVYLPFRVAPNDLESFLADAPRWGLKGLSVTIPHKEAILAVAPAGTKLDSIVESSRSGNTVLLKDDHASIFNTDVPAALGALTSAVGSPTDGPEVLRGKRVLLLGAGGVCRALAFGLRRAGAEVTVACRRPEAAADFKNQFGCLTVAWDDRASVPVDVVINGTPIGMHPKVDFTPYPTEALRSGLVVFDTIYNPQRTRLGREASAAGCRVVSGMEMFIRQAALQFEYFTGSGAPLAVMRKAAEDGLAAQGG